MRKPRALPAFARGARSPEVVAGEGKRWRIRHKPSRMRSLPTKQPPALGTLSVRSYSPHRASSARRLITYSTYSMRQLLAK